MRANRPRSRGSARRRRCAGPGGAAPPSRPRRDRRGPRPRRGRACRSRTRARRIRRASAGRRPGIFASAPTIPATTARPPVTCSSAISSPVKLRGATKRTTSARSSASPADGIAQSAPASRRGRESARLGASASSASAQAGPETRITAIAARPAPEARAKMVSRRSGRRRVDHGGEESSSLRRGGGESGKVYSASQRAPRGRECEFRLGVARRREGRFSPSSCWKRSPTARACQGPSAASRRREAPPVTGPGGRKRLSKRSTARCVAAGRASRRG